MRRNGCLTLLLGLLTLLRAAYVAGDSKHAAKLHLIEELREAPVGRDVYTHIPKAKRSVWEYHDGRSINETLASFTDIPVEVVVAIKLVGFDGDGINHAKLSEQELLRYLRGLHLDLQTAVIEPEARHLSIRPRLHFRVSKAPVALTHRLAGVLTSHIFAAQQNRRQSTVYVPHTVVDDVLFVEENDLAANGRASRGTFVAEEYGTAAPATLTLYLLNLEPPTHTDYLYTYNEAAEVVAAGNWSEFRSCPGALFASNHKAGTGSVAWVDLGAAPQSYGPLRGGHGQVFPHSLPHATSFQPAAVSTAILPELAALAASAVAHLAWPPLQHASMALPREDGSNELEIQIVHMHDTLAVPPRSVNLDVIRDELTASMAGNGLSVVVQEHFLSFALCDLCVNAYTNALRVRTQRQEGSNVVAAAGQVLDRLLLHTTLKEYAEIIMAYSGIQQTHNALPVFVFDLSGREEALLLDGSLQAAAFPDMVIAVASRNAAPVRTRFSCGHMPRSVQPGDATRAVLGGIMQSAFGSPHTALRYNPASGAGWNYLWALGATPFGPLSSLSSLSVSAAGVVGRNVAAVELDKQAGRIAAVLTGLSHLAPNGKWATALERRDLRDRLFARINVAGVKVELAAAALSSGHHADAMRMARHLAYDAAAVERIALTLDTQLTQRLDCRGGTDWMVLLWPPAGSLVAVAAAAWWRGRGARRAAEARYDKIY